jgi:hypothetical protein
MEPREFPHTVDVWDLMEWSQKVGEWRVADILSRYLDYKKSASEQSLAAQMEAMDL